MYAHVTAEDMVIVTAVGKTITLYPSAVEAIVQILAECPDKESAWEFAQAIKQLTRPGFGSTVSVARDSAKSFYCIENNFHFGIIHRASTVTDPEDILADHETWQWTFHS